MYILLICTIICTIILFLVCNVKTKPETAVYHDGVSEVVEKIGDNKQIAKEILKFIGNDKTQVEENVDPKIKASFYNFNTDKITIKNTEDLKDCSRVIHIAHECIHSIQNKKLGFTHFILSNIQILYFLGIFIYFFYNRNLDLRFNLLLIQLFIFILTFFIKVTLESDATYRGPELAFTYLKDKVNEKDLTEFKKNIQNKLYPIVPMSYFSFYMQGALLLIIAQTGAIFI